LTDSTADLARWSLPSDDVARLCGVVEANRDQLDHIDGLQEPRLLHGDLWTANILLDPVADKPTVIGVVDSERAWWGDPFADWTIYRADARAVTAERHAFWSAYGDRPEGPHVDWRRQIYRGRHLVAERVEAARGGHLDRVGATVAELADVLSTLE
jgi:aminoglycoside phosphotransferase (APT) family kinase protein